MSPTSEEPAFDGGTPGASARREYERRRRNREQRIRTRHPRLGGLMLALTDEPAHQTNWKRGSTGERQLARSLAKRLDPGIPVLHDRRIPGSRANIDHIAVAPSGIWVIDAKDHKGKVAISRPLFGKPKLTVAGRDQTKLIAGLDHQVQRVRAMISALAPDAPAHGALCFLEADLPLLGTPTLGGYRLLYPRRLAKYVNRPGPLPVERVRALAEQLAKMLPPA